MGFNEPYFKPGEIIVKFKPEAGEKIEKKLNKELKISSPKEIEELGIKFLKDINQKATVSELAPVFKEVRKEQFPSKVSAILKDIYKIKIEKKEELYFLIQEIRKDPAVLWVEPNYIAKAYDITPNDPFYPQQWALPKIKAPAAWESISNLLQRGSQFLDQEYKEGTQPLNIKQSYQETVSQNFIPKSNGFLEKIEVEVGCWGGGTYTLFGRLTNQQGEILAEGSTLVGPQGQRCDWINLNFTAKPLLSSAQTYKLYLSQSVSWSSFYWKYNFKDNKKNYRLYLSRPPLTITPVTVAVVDTGVDSQHEDLIGKVLPGRNFVDPENPNEDTTDIHGHGTHVTGIIAASFNNSLGIAGVIPESSEAKIKILPVKGLGDDGYGSFAGLTQALLWAAQNNAKVINASWGGSIYSQLMKDTLLAINSGYDCQVIAGAGNERANLDRTPHSPGGYEEVITVGASDIIDQLAVWSDYSGSNYGFRMDLVAPGSIILSLLPQNRYAEKNGTSMATPHVVGVYAVLKSLHPQWTKEQIREIINLSTDDLGEAGKDEIFGFGRLNFQKALAVSEPANLPVAKIISPENDKVIFEGKVVLSAIAYGPNFREYRLSLKVEGSNSGFVPIYTSSTPTSSTQPFLLPEIDLSRYRGNWVILRLETFLAPSNFPNYAADTLRVFVNTNKGWSKKFSAAVIASPAIADFNNDGLLEIFTSGGNSYPIEKEKLYLFNHRGQDMPGWPKEVNSYPLPYQPLITEVRGSERIVVPGYRGFNNDEILVLDEKGDYLPGWPLKNLEIYKRPLVADINADGEKELIFINHPNIGTADPWYNEIFAYSFEDANNDGKPDPVPGWTKPITHLFNPSYLVAADLNGDEYQEIIFTGQDREYRLNVYVLNHQGEFLEEMPIILSGAFWGVYQPVVVDLDKDGDYEILITLRDNAYAFDIKDNKPLLRWSYTPESRFLLTPPLAGDVDGDGKEEIVFLEARTGDFLCLVEILNSSGEVIKTVQLDPQEYFLEFDGEGISATLADLNGDNKLEILVTTLLVNPGELKEYFRISVWELFPSPRKSFEGFLTTDIARSSIIVGDLDNNNRLDMVVNTWDGRLNVFEYPQFYGSYGEVRDKSPWSMFNHDPQNTRNYDFASSLPSSPTATPTPTLSPIPFSCSLMMSQEDGEAKTSLSNSWQYVSFVAKETGWVDKVAVKAGNYGGAQRSITCKVTKNDGSSLSVALSSSPFTLSSGTDWRTIDFKDNKFPLVKNQTYRLYCQGPDSWGSIYWIWDTIKGKTFRIYLCPQQ